MRFKLLEPRKPPENSPKTPAPMQSTYVNKGRFGQLMTYIADKAAIYIFLSRKWKGSAQLRSVVSHFAGISLLIILITGGFAVYFGLLGLLLRVGFGFMFMIVQFVGIFWFISRPRVVTVRPGDPQRETLADYWGQPKLVELVQEWVTILRGDPEFKRMGGDPVRGFLLKGGPGTGKTYLIRCLAGSAGIAVHAIEASSFRGMFWGMDVLRVLNFVSTARKLAREYGACIAYIDEIDAIGMSRSGQAGGQMIAPGGMMGGAGAGALTTLLAQIDGIERESEWSVCRNIARKKLHCELVREGYTAFVGGTNRPEVLDVALLRPGRLDRTIQVDPPDGPGRKEIFEGYLKRVTHDEIDLDKIVINTQNYTPAAIEMAVKRDSVRIARFRNSTVVQKRDLELALIEQIIGISNPIGDMPEKQKRQIAYHEAGHVVATWKYAPHQAISFVSILRRGTSLGLMIPVNLEGRYTYPLTDIVADIYVLLAADVASEVLMESKWAGAMGDNRQIMDRINYLIRSGIFGGPPMNLEGKIPGAYYDKAEKWLEEQREGIVKPFVQAHKNQVQAIADALLEKDELSSDEVSAILESAK